MSTTSKAHFVNNDVNICQGDVFQNVRYIFMDSENDEEVNLVEFRFPMAIIVSQACDVGYMGEMIIGHSGKATKFMPSILMCPIYDASIARKSEHLTKVFDTLSINKPDGESNVLLNSNEYKIVKNDWHYRYHALTVSIDSKVVLDNALIDFKHYFSIPASYLLNNRKDRLFSLDDLYSEQITLKFATYLSRVALPEE